MPGSRQGAAQTLALPSRRRDDGILEGYQDALAGRVVEFKGSLRDAIKDAKRRAKREWK